MRESSGAGLEWSSDFLGVRMVGSRLALDPAFPAKVLVSTFDLAPICSLLMAWHFLFVANGRVRYSDVCTSALPPCGNEEPTSQLHQPPLEEPAVQVDSRLKTVPGRCVHRRQPVATK